jgi:hypothetical protein
MNYKDMELDFERDWSDDEATTYITEYGAELRALEDLHIPKAEIDAFQNRAKANNVTLASLVRVAFQNELLENRTAKTTVGA